MALSQSDRYSPQLTLPQKTLGYVKLTAGWLCGTPNLARLGA